MGNQHRVKTIGPVEFLDDHLVNDGEVLVVDHIAGPFDPDTSERCRRAEARFDLRFENLFGSLEPEYRNRGDLIVSLSDNRCCNDFEV